MYRWPVGLYGKVGDIASIEIPDSAAPLLLSRQTQVTLGAVVDLPNQSVTMRSIDAHDEPLGISPEGHYTVDFTNYPQDGHPGVKTAEELEAYMATRDENNAENRASSSSSAYGHGPSTACTGPTTSASGGATSAATKKSPAGCQKT